MVAMLCLHFDALLITANSTLNSRGDNEARTHVSIELQRGKCIPVLLSPFLICMFAGT